MVVVIARQLTTCDSAQDEDGSVAEPVIRLDVVSMRATD